MSRSVSSTKSRLGTAALVLVNAALAGGFWFAANGAIDISPIKDALPARAENPNGNLTSGSLVGNVSDATTLSGTLARPLFRPDRRPASSTLKSAAIVPPVRVQTPPEPVAEFPKDIRLVGIVKTSGKASQRALLRTGEAPSGQLLGVGEMVAGWRIVSIGQDEILLETGKQRHTLSMFAKADQ